MRRFNQAQLKLPLNFLSFSLFFSLDESAITIKCYGAKQKSTSIDFRCVFLHNFVGCFSLTSIFMNDTFDKIIKRKRFYIVEKYKPTNSIIST